MVLEDYKGWLRGNTNLSENSIGLYARTAASFLKDLPEGDSKEQVTLEALNAFVARSFRDNNSNYVKYSLKPLLEYLGFELDSDRVPKLYKQIMPVKQQPRKKHGNYMPLDVLKKVISNIRHEEYRDLATLQLAIGTRAFEIIELREENIEWDHKPGIIRIFFRIKGNKEGSSFLSHASFHDLLKKYCKGKPGYLFLNEYDFKFEEALLKRAVNTKRSYVYTALNQSARELGINRKIGTHDLRRNFAENLEQSGVHIRAIQKALNHSNIRTTMKYFSESREDVREAVIRHQEGEP